MAHNFKLTSVNHAVTGNIGVAGVYNFCSPAGDNNFSGTAPDTPKRTIQGLLGIPSGSNGANYIIGAGVYTGSFTLVGNTHLRADGEVILKTNSGTVTGSQFVYDITFIGFNFSAGITAYRCKFINCTFSLLPVTAGFYDCVFINCTGSSTAGNTTYDKCFFQSCNLANVRQMTNCHLSTDSKISFHSNANTLFPGAFKHNNIENTTTGNGYGVAINNGIAVSDYRTHAEWQALDPAKYNPGGMAVNPQVNDASLRAFNYRNTSPLIYAASDGGNIGGRPFATLQKVSGAGADTRLLPPASGGTAEYTNMRLLADGQAVIDTNNNTEGGAGIIRSDVYDLGRKQPIKKINYLGRLDFESRTGVNNPYTSNPYSDGNVANANVPDYNQQNAYSTSAMEYATNNPNRLTYRIRFSDAPFSKGDILPAWYVMEWNQPLKTDAAGKGTGEPDYNPSAAQTTVEARYYQLEITLVNNYKY